MGNAPVFDSTLESPRGLSKAEGENNKVNGASLNLSDRMYGVLYAFAPESCIVKKHRAVYDFIEHQAKNYPDLEVVYVSVDGKPRFKFFHTKELQYGSTVDSIRLSADQIKSLLDKHIEATNQGKEMLTEDEQGIEVSVDEENLTLEDITRLLDFHHIHRGFPKSS